jgi:adenylate kinase family enzyme
MKKVLVIGPGGAGKSTFAEQLAARTGLPLIHLDALYWRPGWVEMPKAEWASLIERVAGEPEWIMDGNYGGTLDQRLEACDTAILLDTSPWRCVWRVVWRRVRHAGRSRPGLAAGCHERLDGKFLWWIATYRVARRPRVLARLEAMKRSGKTVVILRSPSEIQRFLSSLP